MKKKYDGRWKKESHSEGNLATVSSLVKIGEDIILIENLVLLQSKDHLNFRNIRLAES